MENNGVSLELSDEAVSYPGFVQASMSKIQGLFKDF